VNIQLSSFKGGF